MDYKATAESILGLVGGKDNVTSATHCMTRLRLTVKDLGKVQDAEVKKVKGVVGTNTVGQQYQVIIGTEVGKVYDEFCALGGFEAKAAVDADEDVSATGEKKKITAKGVLNNIMDAISSCVTPLIPIITAAGLVKLIVAILGPSMLNLLPETSDFMRIMTIVGDAGFYFFPFYVGYGAAKKFKCSIPLSLFLAGIMLHPSLIDIVNAGEPFTVYGIPMTLVNYSNNFISILLSVWVMSYIQRFLEKHVPTMLKSLIVPLGLVLIMTPLTLCVFGPLGSWIGQGIAAGISAIHSVLGPVSVAIVCAFWPFLVATGMHQALIAIAMGNIATFGYDQAITVGGFLSSYPVMATALAYIIRCKDPEDKAQSITNLITLAAGGVTEPTLFGLILQHKKAMAYVVAGGLASGFVAGLLGVRTYLFGSANVLAVLSFAGEWAPSVTYGLIAAVVGFAVSLVLGLVFGYDDKKQEVEA